MTSPRRWPRLRLVAAESWGSRERRPLTLSSRRGSRLASVRASPVLVRGAVKPAPGFGTVVQRHEEEDEAVIASTLAGAPGLQTALRRWLGSSKLPCSPGP